MKKLKKDLKLKSGVVHPKGSPVSVTYQPVGYQWAAVLNIGGSEVKLNPKNLHVYVSGFRKPPSINTMRKWSGTAKTVSGKTTEPDGTGSDGSPSWLLVLGLI